MERVGEICFIKQDQWARAALLRDDEISFNATLVEIAIKAADDKQDVDVGGEDLLLKDLPGCLRDRRVLRSKT